MNNSKESPKFNPFAGSEIEKVIYTTKSQSEIWTSCSFGGNDASRAYNLSLTIDFDGLFEIPAMELAVQTLVNRHESLRATFSTDGVYMSIFKELSIDFSKLNVSNLDKDSRNEALENYKKEDANYIFDLVNGPLIKVGLITFSEVKHSLTLNIHHIICDGWSIGIILEELGIIYSALVENKTPQLPESIPFTEYANEEQLFANSNDYKEIEKYWHSLYEQSVPVVDLPTDNPRPPLRTFESERLDFVLNSELVASIKKIGVDTSTSLNTTMLASFEVFLSQVTGQNDIVVGVPAAGQPVTGMNCLIGHCVNLLPLRSNPEPNISFNDYLNKRKIELFDAYDNQQVSFGHLLQKLNVPRDPSRIPLVPITFSVDLSLTDKVLFSNLEFTLKNNPRSYENFELFLNVSSNEKNLVFEWSFNKFLFSSDTITKMMASFEKILNKIVEDPSHTLEQITFQDYSGIYNKLNDTEISFPNISLSELLAKQAEISPNNVALEYNDTKISYHDLQIKVNQFAHYLEAQGIKSGDYIAVSYPRSPELVYSILAIIQCGAAYLPLDHEYPAKRVEYMMEDSKAKFLLTSKALSLTLPKCSNTLLIDDAMASLEQYPSTKLPTEVNPENVLYLLYTSGSTGKPKGAKISNRNVVNLLFSLENEPGIKETDRVPFISTISFDIASFELFFPLFKGATLVLPNHETAKDGTLLYEMLENEKISLMVGTTTTYMMLCDAGWTKKLPIKIWCCGEPLPIPAAKELLKRGDELWNLYGPTEVTIFSSCKHIKNEETLISVGGPIANMQYYIVDENLKLLPPNTVGEIAIGGLGVGKGYLGRPELTAEKFIPNIFSNKKDDIMYLSGDIGKLLPSNEVVCLGRVDHQVKVRGHRIEIGEIEQALMAIEGIKSAIVVAKTDILVAFIIVNSEIADEMEQIRFWRNELASQLPAFMVPHEFHILERMPKTLNDKIDRTALLEYKSNSQTEQEYNAPRTTEEKLVAEIWEENLKKERIDIFSNFFEIGGHSIIAVTIVVKIQKVTGTRIPLAAIFENPTIEKFAKLLHLDNEFQSDYLVPIKPKGNKPPLFIVHGAGLNVLNFKHIVSHFDDNQPVYGIQGIGPNGYDNWFESIEEMAACYNDSIIKINPNGPYALAGFSFGGMVAFEMARQLKEQGKTVSIIALLDTYVDSSYYCASLWQKKLLRYYDRTYRRLDYLMEMLTSWKAFKMRAKTKKDYILKTYFGQKDSMTEQEGLALEQFTIANGMVNKIVDRYHLKPQNVEVDLFRAEDDTEYKLDPKHLGWKKAALNGVTIHNVPGDHIAIVDPPNDKVLARMIQDILNQRHTDI
jgi:amino acid adenylation domain-containing protein